MKAIIDAPLTGLITTINIPSRQEGVRSVHVYDVSHLFDLIDDRERISHAYTTHLDHEILTVFIHDKDTRMTIDDIDRTKKVDRFIVQMYNDNTIVLDLYNRDGHIDTYYFDSNSGMIIEYDGSGRVKIIYNG